MESGTTISASTLYYVYVIHNPTTGASDAIFSASGTSPTLPSGYTVYRRIWAFLTDATPDIRLFTPSGNYCRLHIPFNDVNDSTVADDTYETYTMSCPPLSLAHIYGRTYNNAGASEYIYIRTGGTSDGPATYSTEHTWLLASTGGTGTTNTAISQAGFILVDSSRQINAAPDEVGGTTVVSIIILGWIDLGLDQ